jgi:hypothetical protein
MMSKYNAKSFWYDWVNDRMIEAGKEFTPNANQKPHMLYFQSYLEWEVFKMLAEKFSIKNITKDYSIVLAKGKGQNENVQIKYKVDFRVAIPEQKTFFLVEAKGYLTPEARLKLKLLAINHPVLAANTHLVFKKAIKVIADAPVYFHSMESFQEWLTSV